MADDTGAHRAVATDQINDVSDRRGPLRPDRMQTARTRASGPGLARLFQFAIAGAFSVTVMGLFWGYYTLWRKRDVRL